MGAGRGLRFGLLFVQDEFDFVLDRCALWVGKGCGCDKFEVAPSQGQSGISPGARLGVDWERIG